MTWHILALAAPAAWPSWKEGHMPHEKRDERDLAELTVEELEAEEAIILPDREALSLINPHLPTPATTVTIFPTQPAEPGHEADPRELPPLDQEPQDWR
jgi:hypothetical protein